MAMAQSFTGFHEISRDFMGFHEILRDSTGFIFAWVFRESCGISWNIILFPNITRARDCRNSLQPFFFLLIGYKWHKIDEGKNYFLQLSCDNQPIGNIQNNKEIQNFARKVRVTAVEFGSDMSFNYINKSLITGGYFGEIFNIFSKKFNVSYIPNKEYGTFINGRWTGMIGDLTYGRADICSGISMTRWRRNAMSFSPKMFSDKYDLVYRKLDREEWNYTFYLQPYNMEMWLCAFAISLAVILVKIIGDRVTKNKQFGSSYLNLSDELLLCWPIVLQRNLFSSLVSTKLVFGVYVAFSMLLLVSYNSTLTSLLSTSDLKIPFSSLDDMIENTNFLPAILKGGVMEEMFQASQYENVSVRRVTTEIEGIEAAYSGKFGYISSLQYLHYFIGNNCSFAAALYPISTELVSLGYSKEFVYIEYFSYKILMLKQYGILSAEFKRHYPERHRCSENLSIRFRLVK
uniref:Ionotropic glutamate receptor C-terminal domain-containing protein n=1 Tax=Strigamia maritima TaxID=126957 RepID=T1IWG5_STRMM